MKLISTTLSCLLLVSFAGCDDKKDAKKEAKPGDEAAAKKDDATPGDVKAEEVPTPEVDVTPPELTATAVADWGVQVGVPEGSKLGEAEAGDADMEMPDSLTIATESACGIDVELTRHWAKSLDSMYENSKKGVEGLTEVEWVKDEKTETSYTIHYKGKAPLGDMYGASTGLVVGDRLVLCEDAGLGRLEAKEAACVLAVCSSLTAGEGDAAAADAEKAAADEEKPE